MIKKTARKAFAFTTDNNNPKSKKTIKSVVNGDFKKFLLKVVSPVLGISLVAGGIAYLCDSHYIYAATNNYMEQPTSAADDTAVLFAKGEAVSAVGLYFGDELGCVAQSDVDNDALINDVLESAALKYRNAYAQLNCELSYQKGIYPVADVMNYDSLKHYILENLKKYIKVTESLDENVAIPYSVQAQYDPTKPENYFEVIQEGKNGSKHVVSEVTYENGKKTGVHVISTKITTKAVDKIIITGSKLKSGVVTGSFIWPCEYTHNIFSGFGYREDGYHGGIDINNGDGIYGQDVLASDGGIVVKAAFDSYGYGYHVEIDHGNGYMTRYAHLSDIYVNVGEYVSQGTVIGAVGSTGNSEAPHLHFEIIVDNERVDPTLYVN